MRLRGTNRNFRRVSPRVPFNPRKLFRNSEQGVWFDQSDLSTLFQDSAGTTPVTAVEQPVGLMLDKRLGLVLGADVKNTGATGVIGSATAATYSTASGSGTGSRVDVTNQSFVSFSGLASTTSYKIDITNTGTTPISIRINSVGGTTAFVVLAGQQVKGVVSSVSSIFIASGAASGAFAFTVNSVRELPGNHAFQPTAIDRPILRARKNWLVATDVLATQSVTVRANPHVLSFWGTGTITLSGASTAGPLVGTGADNRVSLTFTPTAGTLTLTVTGSVLRAQLEDAV